jgi:probable F420-dependent oxidoreductase
MKLGLFAINYATCGAPAIAVTVAQAAEAAGFESVWTGEHVVLPDPKPPTMTLAPATPMLDTIVALTLVSAHTTTLRVGSGIIVLPQRNPLVLAKELASVDVVSGGRLTVGVGAGYVEREFEALNVPMARRGARMDDYLRAMRAVWTQEHPAYHGEFVSFSGVTAYPRPVQQPLPILIGGESDLALRRAVTLGQGWYGFALTIEQTAQCLRRLRRVAERHDRLSELGELEISVTPAGPLSRPIVEAYAGLGVHRLIVTPQPDASREQRHTAVALDDILRNLDTVANLA